ncbi:MAG: hypothetical protein H6718_13980 [Polyangiaceae bacterium]|nr:hypothetical protein [Myxococcales bacterium]MCB9586507.1 hypothetical protein [Polyangiaceae bacterium]MCB9606014.1 hypothetical protein [Polyangiaceae bacterium]
MLRSSQFRILTIALAGSCWLSGGVAVAADDAPNQQQCADSYVKAQTQRRDGDLMGAREQLLVCASQTCLAAVQKDCAQWLTEVESSVPSVVFEIEGADVKDVHVEVDGVAVDEDARAGRAVSLNPGKHTFKFTFPDGTTKEQEVTLLEGQKNKAVKTSAGGQGADATSGNGAGDASGPEPTPGEGPGALPWAFVGLGVVGLGVATGFWLDASGKLDDLDGSGCAPNCSSSDRDAIEQSRLIGDIGFGVGIVSLGVATVLWLGSGSGSGSATMDTEARRKRREQALKFDVRGVRGGSLATFGGSF